VREFRPGTGLGSQGGIILPFCNVGRGIDDELVCPGQAASYHPAKIASQWSQTASQWR